LQLIKKHKVKY